MYKILKLNSENGNFTELEQHETIIVCKSKAKNYRTEKDLIIIVFEPKEDENDFDHKLVEIIEENQGNILRITKGITVTKNIDSVCCGQGSNCFCVVTSDSKRCETQYCSGNLCYWVPCGIPCGC